MNELRKNWLNIQMTEQNEQVDEYMNKSIIIMDARMNE